VKYLVSGAVEPRRSVVATFDNLGVSSPASLPATGRSIPRIRPLRGDEKVASLVLPVSKRPPGAPGEVSPGRADPADSTVIAEATVASIAAMLSSASHDAHWRTHVARRPVIGEIAVPAFAVGQVGPGVHTRRLDESGVLGCSPRLALQTERHVACDVVQRRGRIRRAGKALWRRSHAAP
jgi:hypothetical protein